MIRNIRALTVASYVSMFFLGVGSTIIGAAARNIGLSPYQIGLLLTLQNLGFTFSVMLSGALADTQDKTKVLFVGSAILAIAFLTFYLSHSFTINLFIMFCIGAGSGTYEGVTDAMLIDIHSEKESLYINVNHFFVTFGALMITLYLIFLQMNWRNSSTQSGIAVALLALFFMLAKLEKRSGSVEKLTDRLKFLLREPAVGILFFAIMCAVGLELGTIGIMTTYLMELRDFTQITSKIALLIFLAGIASGRLIIGFFLKTKQIPYFIALLFGSATIFMSVFYFTNLPYLTYGLVYLTGMTISSLLPLVITIAGLMYKKLAGTVMGIVKIAIPIGGILIPLLLSILSKYASFRAALLLFPFFAAAGFLSLLGGWKKFHNFINQGT